MNNIWNSLLAEIKKGYRVFLVLVVEASKGSPGKPLHAMLLCENGNQIGTIGGGVMEYDLIQTGREVINSGIFKTQLIEFEHKPNSSGKRSGLVCGGSQTCLLSLVDPSYIVPLHQFVEAINQDKKDALIISPDGWYYQEMSQHNKSIDLKQKEGSWSVVLNSLNFKRVVIFGGGHCGTALAAQMLLLGFRVSVIEPRSTPIDGNGQNELRRYQPTDFYLAAELIDYPELTFAVVLTSSLHSDVDALQGVLKRSFPFIGLMGSQPKINKIKSTLFEQGFSKKDWQRVSCPVGLTIPSDTPEEIAVSIAAQILQQRRRLDSA